MSTPAKPVKRTRTPADILREQKAKGMKAIADGTFTPTPKPRDPVIETSEPEVEDNPSDFVLAAQALFEGATNTPTVTIDGAERIVKIREATMVQMPTLMLFFGGIVEGMDPKSLAELVDVVVHKQKLAIAQGKDPANVDLTELATEEMVGKVFDHMAVLSTLLAATFTLLPGLVAAFTDLSEQDYGKLAPDDGLKIVGGVFLLNYGFFTRNVPPMFKVFIASWARRKSASK